MNPRTAARSMFAVALTCTALMGCSPMMEADRPTPVDLSQFHKNEPRLKVVSVVGAPQGHINDKGLSCDVYKLYTEGHNLLSKGLITTGEVLGDVATLGLAEIFFTPAQSMTKEHKHTVLFCYGPNDTLAQISNSSGT